MPKRSMKDLPRTDQPRERMIAMGVENLTDAELLAILLASGTKKKNVLSVAKEILKEFPKRKLSEVTFDELIRIDGVAEVKAGKLLAAFELGKRIHTPHTNNQILTPLDVISEIKDITTKSQEHLVALYLNARHELLQKQTISVGTLNQVIIEPRDIFSYALLLPSLFIILVHNHPSQDPSPSPQDRSFTKRLVEAGKLLGIQIIDHIVVTKEKYTSFKEEKLM